VSNIGARLKSWASKLRPFVPLAVRVALGVLFLYAGVQKALDLNDAVLTVHGYAVAPGFLVHPVALGLTLLEITLGVLLLLGLCTRFAAGGVAVLAAIFLGVLIQAKIRGLDISCGCFGGDGTGNGVSWLDILRDLPILAAALYVVWRGPGPFALDRLLHARSSERELRVGVPLVLVFCIVVASLAVPVLTGALDLPQAAAPDQVSVSGAARSAPLPAGSAVPDFSAPALFGGTVSWRDYRGAPTVLVLWAPWCAECRQQLPALAQVAGDFPGVRLVSIATAAGELPGPTPEQFMQSHQLSFPVALDSTDQRLADAFGVQGYPTVYYVTSDGTVSQVTVGAASEDAIRSSIQAIQARP
jgi:putative oxidoreductase